MCPYALAQFPSRVLVDGVGERPIVSRAIGVHVIAAALAGPVAAVAAAAVGTRYGRRAAIQLDGVVAVPIFAAFYRFVEPTGPRLSDRSMRDPAPDYS